MLVKEFAAEYIPLVKEFTDLAVGMGYYSEEELSTYQKNSVADSGENCSFVLYDPENNKVLGLRLAFPPGNWNHGKGSNLRPDLWPTKLNETGYFQSLFVSPDLQGQGWGPKLAQKSLSILKKIGAKGVVAHCWKESPHNSSLKYLEKVGFKKIIEHPNYWINVDYVCTRDGNPCRCTAIEMHLNLMEIK